MRITLIVFSVLLGLTELLCSGQQINLPDLFPTEQDVHKKIQMGMTRSQVVAQVGKPAFASEYPNMVILFYLKPNDGPIGTVPEYHVYAGFKVALTNDKVTNLSIIHSDHIPQHPK
jgi:hypothetical protein